METPPQAADDQPGGSSEEEGKPRAHCKLADGNINAPYSLEPLWSGSSVSTVRLGPSVASSSVGSVTSGTSGAGEAASIAAHTDQGQHRETTDRWPHDTQRSAFTHTGSNSAGTSSSAITTASRETINLGLNIDRFVAFKRRPDTLWSIEGAASGGISEPPASRTISTATNEHSTKQHDTRSRSMTTANPALLLPYTRYGTIHTSNPSSYLEKSLVCDTTSSSVATTDMMLSPTGSEVSYLTMDSDSRTSSRTSTPTMVRTRPRLPAGMVRHKDVLVAAAAAAVVTSTAATPPPSGTRAAEDIVCDFDSLGRTDFVRKYSTKIRSKNDHVQIAGDGQVTGGQMSPQTIPRSLPTSPVSTLTVEGDRNTVPRPRAALAPQRSRSVKLRLELLKEARKKAENDTTGHLTVDRATLARMVRNDITDGQSKDSMSTCDTKEQKPPVDKIHESCLLANSQKDKNNSLPIKQLHMKNLSKSQPHLIDDRLSEVLTRRHHSSSPKEFSPTPADLEVRDTFSKPIVLDRRLRMEDTCRPKDTVTSLSSSEPQTALCSAGIQSPPLISSAPVVATEMDTASTDLITGASSAVQNRRSIRVAKPAAVHWQLDKDKPANHSSGAGQPVNPINDRLRDISEAEDEGVAGMDDEANDFHSRARRYKSKVKPGEKGKKVIEWAVEPIPEITKAHVSPLLEDKRDRESPKSSDSGDSSSGGQGKSHYGRFLTHPPSKERANVSEGGPRDTNGFGSLKESPDLTEPLSITAMTPQLSATSLDSHLCGAEVELSASYPEVVQDVTAESTDMNNLERKNSKNVKHKSKSDPCGEKQKEVIRMQPNLQMSMQSTPLLIEEPANNSQDSIGSLQTESARGQKSVSDSSLLSGRSSLDSTPGTKRTEDSVVFRLPQSPRKRNNRVSKDAKSSPAKESLDTHSTKTRSSKSQTSKVREPFQSSVTESSDSTLDKQSSHKQTTAPTSSLTLPFPKKNVTALTRSHSSASVFISKGEAYRNTTPSPGSSRQKDLAKKRPPILESFSSSPGGSLDIGSSKRDRSWASTTASGYFPSLEPIFSQSSLSVFESSGDTKDKRDLILQEFYTSEDQYVESLQMLVERYMIPMKTQGILDSGLVDDIFYKVNEIYMHHATFLTFLGKALKDWDSQTSTIGDIIYRNFSKQTVIESYVSFIEHFPRAEKVLYEISAKSSFQKFIDVCDRDNRIRLPLKAIIVKPAQRIPRYELLLKRLLENTPPDHPDHALLLEAESSLHHLALQINSTKDARQEEDYQDTLKKLELLLITDLIAVDRRYIRHDMVQLLSRKDQCCIWLFSDLAVFSSVKRKSGPVNRKTMLLQSPTGNDFIENCKHKMWLKISLEDLEIVQVESSPARQQLVEKDVLEYDMVLLNEIKQLAERLNCDYAALEETLTEVVHQVNKQLAEHQRKSPPPEANKVQLMANTTEGLDHLALVFPTPDKKHSWEGAFVLAKQKLAALAEGKPPEFMQSLPITKTRAGMQFSCAAPMEGFNEKHYHDVWVCNSDGYVGHMCLLSLQPEPIVTLNTPVPGCNSRILCICAVPALHGAHKRKLSRRKVGITNSTPPQIHVDKVKVERNHSNVSSSTKKARSRQTSESVPAQSSEEASSSSEDSAGSGDSASSDDEATDNTEDKIRKISTGSGRVKHLLSGARSSPQESKNLDPQKSTMWLGTEDGCIHVFPSNENLKTTKNKVKLQQHNSVLTLCYIEYKVFAALSNGEIVVYKNNTDGTWDLSSRSTLSLGAGSSPVNKMLAVAGRLWCACQQDIYVVNPDNLQVEVSFCGDPESKKPVQCMATSGNGVWLSSQGSSRVSLYHALSHQYLAQLSVAPTVSAKLQSADDIIRQHKTACLRVTSLLTCKDLLWIGTSAGVILTLPLPKISQATSRGSVVLGQIQGLLHGHTGHVRFLTSVDMTPVPRRRGGVAGGHGDASQGSAEPSPKPWISRRMSIGVHNFTMATKMLVISGGDGYEDFSAGASSECTGRDDSTNHLLTWQV